MDLDQRNFCSHDALCFEDPMAHAVRLERDARPEQLPGDFVGVLERACLQDGRRGREDGRPEAADPGSRKPVGLPLLLVGQPDRDVDRYDRAPVEPGP